MNSLPCGLVDLMQDEELFVTSEYVTHMLAEPLPDDATVDDYRFYFRELQAERIHQRMIDDRARQAEIERERERIIALIDIPDNGGQTGVVNVRWLEQRTYFEQQK